MDHNIILVDGVEHKAVYVGESRNCDQCSLEDTPSCDYHPCMDFERADRKNVVYKRHYRPKHSELIEVKVLDDENGN